MAASVTATRSASSTTMLMAGLDATSWAKAPLQSAAAAAPRPGVAWPSACRNAAAGAAPARPAGYPPGAVPLPLCRARAAVARWSTACTAPSTSGISRNSVCAARSSTAPGASPRAPPTRPPPAAVECSRPARTSSSWTPSVSISRKSAWQLARSNAARHCWPLCARRPTPPAGTRTFFNRWRTLASLLTTRTSRGAILMLRGVRCSTNTTLCTGLEKYIPRQIWPARSIAGIWRRRTGAVAASRQAA